MTYLEPKHFILLTNEKDFLSKLGHVADPAEEQGLKFPLQWLLEFSIKLKIKLKVFDQPTDQM